VEQIRAGDEIAFRDLYFAFYQPLCAFVLGYVQSPAVAEEIVQDLLAKVWRQRATWWLDGSIQRYLFGAARNRAFNWVRAERVAQRWRKRAEHESGITGMGQGPRGADRQMYEDELHAALDRAMQRLPVRQREAFDLRWRGQLSHAEIGAAMGISAKSVENTLRRAFKALREELTGFL
jgi:RNA polymerase sigma-70 factor (ECF subfamily)